MAVRAPRVFLLQPCTVEQQHLGEVTCGRRAVDRAGEALFHERGQEAAVVQVRVAQHHRVDRARVDREGRPVALAQRLEALVEAAVEQDALATELDEVARAGDRIRRAEEADSHDTSLGR